MTWNPTNPTNAETRTSRRGTWTRRLKAAAGLLIVGLAGQLGLTITPARASTSTAGTNYQPFAADFNGDHLAVIGMRDTATGIFFVKHGPIFGDQISYSWGDGSSDSGGKPDVPPTDPNARPTGSTKCFLVGVRSNYSNWNDPALTGPGDKGFKWLNTNYSYTLVLKGVETKVVDADGRYQYWFEPSTFGIKGGSAANAGGNPSGQSLGGQVVFQLFSSKRDVSYSLSYPWGASINWNSDHTVSTIASRTIWNATALSVSSGQNGWANPMLGAAGPKSGLNRVTVRSAVFPGADSGAYNSPVSTWNIQPRYASPWNSSPSYGMSSINCSSIAWNN
jgi:hypothetical protein